MLTRHDLIIKSLFLSIWKLSRINHVQCWSITHQWYMIKDQSEVLLWKNSEFSTRFKNSETWELMILDKYRNEVIISWEWLLISETILRESRISLKLINVQTKINLCILFFELLENDQADVKCLTSATSQVLQLR